MNILIHILGFFFVGVIVYYVDSKVGLRVHRWWYDLTHKNPLPEGVNKGMIIEQSIVQRIVIAALVVAVEIYLSSLMGAASLIVDVFLGLSGILGMVLGFYFSGNILKIVPASVGQTVGKAVDYLEKVESGEADLKEDIMGGAAAVGTKITDAVTEHGLKEVIKKIKPEKEEKIEKVEEPEAEPESEKITPEEPSDSDKKEDDDDWREGIDTFLKK